MPRTRAIQFSLASLLVGIAAIGTACAFPFPVLAACCLLLGTLLALAVFTVCFLVPVAYVARRITPLWRRLRQRPDRHEQ